MMTLPPASELLSVEDNPFHVAKDGQQALEYVFCHGGYASCNLDWLALNQPHR